MKLGEPLKPNTAMLACTLAIVAALIWNVQVNRYQVTPMGYVFDSISLSFFDPSSKVWIALEE